MDNVTRVVYSHRMLGSGTEAEYASLLGRLFENADDLRRFLREVRHVEPLFPVLPGPPCSLQELADAAVGALRRHGIFRESEFWLRLEHEQPAAKTDVRRLREELLANTTLLMLETAEDVVRWTGRATQLLGWWDRTRHVYLVSTMEQIDHFLRAQTPTRAADFSLRTRPPGLVASCDDVCAEIRRADVVALWLADPCGLQALARREIEFALLIGRPLVVVRCEAVVLSLCDEYLLAEASDVVTDRAYDLPALVDVVSATLNAPVHRGSARTWPDERIDRVLRALHTAWPTHGAVAILAAQIGMAAEPPKELQGPALFHWFANQIVHREGCARRFLSLLRVSPLTRPLVADVRELLRCAATLGERWLVVTREGEEHHRMTVGSGASSPRSAALRRGEATALGTEPGVEIYLECSGQGISLRITASAPGTLAGSILRIWRGMSSVSRRLWPRDRDTLGDADVILLEDEIELAETEP